MSENPIARLQQKISLALDTCIEKMADSLSRQFDATDRDSIHRFRNFCSAIKTRLQWRKSLCEPVDNSPNTARSIQESVESKPNQKSITRLLSQAVEDTIAQFTKTNSPLRSLDTKNGLLMTR